MRKAVYAASFDPITNGHLWCIRQGIRVFDQLVVACGTNPDKRPTFSLEERVEMVKEATEGYQNVEIDTYEDQFLIHYVRSVGAEYILRGIRTEADYEYERAMRHINSDLDSNVVTVFVMPPREISEVSSSVVKGLVGPEGWQKVIRRYVPDPVYRRFEERFSGKNGGSKLKGV